MKNSTCNNSNFEFKDNSSYTLVDEAFSIDDQSLQSIIFTILYIFIFVFGVFTNLILIVIFLFSKQFKRHSSYFFASLSISDFLVLIVCVPIAITDLHSYEWFYGVLYCKMYYCIQYCITLVSSLTIILISVERYCAICYPFKVNY